MRNIAIRGIQILDGEIGLTQLASAIGISLGLADSAVQPGDLPNFGDIVTHGVSEFATSAQGTLADSALQSLAFTQLTDSAGVYSGHGGEGIKVNIGEDGLEYYVITDVGIIAEDIEIENQSSLCNDITVLFTLATSPIANSVELYLNGLLQQEGVGKDYTIDDKEIIFISAPETDDKLIIYYIKTKALEENCYGVSWDESADTYSRVGDLVGQSVGQTLSNSLLPIQAKMRRCVVANNGTVNYYLGATDSTKKADMVTASVLDGTDGQVMVEIPKFWYKHSYAGTTHTWEICNIAKSGYSVHPAFMSDATELDYIYVGAYEAVLYDYSGSAYIDYASGATITPAEDILSSVTGKKPVTNYTRVDGRSMANRRGIGWTGMLYDVYSAVQLLYLIEYASFNSQTMIGSGISNVTDWDTYNNYYPIAPSGNSNSIGNASGNTAGSTECATDSTEYMSYRGIENFFGHIWKWLDGINTNNDRSYICNNIANLADDTSSNYTDIGINNINSDGYQNTMLNISRGFLPASADADSGNKITDYFARYGISGWMFAISGGSSDCGLDAGFFYLRLDYGSGYSDSTVGFRVCFRK